jgi:hypothetical protein
MNKELTRNKRERGMHDKANKKVNGYLSNISAAGQKNTIRCIDGLKIK